VSEALALGYEQLTAIRASHKPRVQFADDTFPEQAAFINDQSHLIALLGTRRCGKSLGVGRKLFKAAHDHPGSSALYIGLTRDEAKRIMWKDALKPLSKSLGLEARFNETELSCRLANGSMIYLLGIDSTEEQKQKLLGQKYSGVVVDEAASFTIDLNELVYRVLDPATMDLNGWIALTGTPGNVKHGLFFDVTLGQDPGVAGTWEKRHVDKRGGSGAGVWHGHRWNTERNPYMRKQYIAKLAQLRATDPGIEQTPGYQQEYLGRWVIDDTKLVYRYAPGRNDFSALPVFRTGRWHHVLGVDLGYEDPTALVLCAYHDHDRTLYVLEAAKYERLDITSTAEKIREVLSRYDVDRVVIDNANKQAVEEMKRRHNLPLHAADKTGKADFIEIMNGEMIMARVKLGPGCEALAEEYGALVWDERSSKREEHPNCANHLADAALYAWRACYPYLSEPAAPERSPRGTAAWGIEEEDAMEALEVGRAESEHREQTELEAWT